MELRLNHERAPERTHERQVSQGGILTVQS
jgi:hypothetical protein